MGEYAGLGSQPEEAEDISFPALILFCVLWLCDSTAMFFLPLTVPSNTIP